MKSKTIAPRKSSATIQLPPGVKRSTEKVSAELLKELMSDNGIASGGRNTILRTKKSSS
jgi:hypothetical protein